MRTILALALTLSIVPAAAQTPAPARAEILVLGTYHMNNPGRDIYNSKVDDVLAPKRQAEMAQLIEVLERFQPTKIAVERNAGDERIKKDYAAYLAGTHELTRNEIEQVGFRLAKKLGDRKSTRVNSSHSQISYAVFCLKKKKNKQ